MGMFYSARKKGGGGGSRTCVTHTHTHPKRGGGGILVELFTCPSFPFRPRQSSTSLLLLRSSTFSTIHISMLLYDAWYEILTLMPREKRDRGLVAKAKYFFFLAHRMFLFVSTTFLIAPNRRMVFHISAILLPTGTFFMWPNVGLSTPPSPSHNNAS